MKVLTRPSYRIRRELATITAMMKIYCRAHHRSPMELCDECQKLLDYAEKRLGTCPFQENKPTCANCPIHCYKPDMRAKIKRVMRYSGPRMILRHPYLALCHLLDGRKKMTQEHGASRKMRSDREEGTS